MRWCDITSLRTQVMEPSEREKLRGPVEQESDEHAADGQTSGESTQTDLRHPQKRTSDDASYGYAEWTESGVGKQVWRVLYCWRYTGK